MLGLHLGMIVLMLDFGYDQGWGSLLMTVSLPHTLAPLTLSVLMGRRVAVFSALYVTLLGMVIAVALTPLTYMAAAVLGGFLSVAVSGKMRKRSRLIHAGLILGAAAAGFAVMLSLAGKSATPPALGMLVGLPFFSGLLTAMLVSGILPVLESVFGVTTEITWLELSDLNHPLMRRLSIEAPGTYHHSLMVASLSEAAAEAIGADATMCRVCSYFHDVGKLSKPEYFIENGFSGENPHESLTPRMSALVLIAHVKDGVDLGIKYNLNTEILDVIEQHHGTTLTLYFYRKALKDRADQLKQAEEGQGNEDDVPQVSEDVFRYPGPRPQFKEAAIISLADAVESSSRSITKPSSTRIEALIEMIVQDRVADGQLDECDLTIAELARVKASFAKTLLSMMHGRIKYGLSGLEEDTPPVKAPTQGAFVDAQADLLEASFPLHGAKKRQARTAKSGNISAA